MFMNTKPVSYTKTILTSKQLTPQGDTLPLPISSYEFSEDESKLMFQKMMRLFSDIHQKPIISSSISQQGNNPALRQGQAKACNIFADASKVAFIMDNNIFIRDLALSLAASDGKDGDKAISQVTTDGKINAIINGATDWVYEEEFGFSKALFWSPDGSDLAYYRFDESNVREYQLTYYGELYPEQSKYKYPKAGEDNSVVGIFIYSVKTGNTLPVDIGKETDIYIPRIKWTSDPGTLALYRMNRHQNKLELLLAGATGGQTQIIWSEDNKSYIESPTIGIPEEWQGIFNQQ